MGRQVVSGFLSSCRSLWLHRGRPRALSLLWRAVCLSPHPCLSGLSLSVSPSLSPSLTLPYTPHVRGKKRCTGAGWCGVCARGGRLPKAGDHLKPRYAWQPFVRVSPIPNFTVATVVVLSPGFSPLFSTILFACCCVSLPCLGSFCCLHFSTLVETIWSDSLSSLWVKLRYLGITNVQIPHAREGMRTRSESAEGLTKDSHEWGFARFTLYCRAQGD